MSVHPTTLHSRASASVWTGWPLLLLVWALTTLIGLGTRTMIPVDELRYASVAWEMWSRGDFLVPWLNGAAYSHKPPLFFWLVHALWWLFGVGELAVRLVAPLLTLVNLLLCGALARLLWPQQSSPAQQVPMVLFSCVVLTGFSVWVQMDLLLVACVQLALCGVVIAGHGRSSGWWLTGAAIGLGLLAKGPVVLLHVLPVTWLAPFWLGAVPPSRRAWYGRSLLSVLLGAVIVLAWAIPAAQAGGEAYRHAIFWGQTANRVVESFAHAHPFWWYLPWLPVLFAPWSLLPWLWRGLRPGRQSRDAGFRFCLTWLFTVLVLLSLVSGKQIKYLLPILPAFALLTAQALASLPAQPVTQRPWLLAVLLALLGAVGMRAAHIHTHAQWLTTISPWWGALLLVLAMLLLVLPPARPLQYPPRMLLLSAAALAIAEAGVIHTGAHAYDLREAGRQVGAAQAAGQPVAITERYHGQFGFYGRLTGPIEEVDPAVIGAWLQRHPDGMLVITGRRPVASCPGVQFEQPFQSGFLALARVPAAAADPLQLQACVEREQQAREQPQ